MKKKKLFAQADWQASYDKRKHTEDCLEANDDTSPMKGKCICPKAQHTPGPWLSHKAANDEYWIEQVDKPVIVARGIEKEADANLIAAAPELLEALKLMRDDLKDCLEINAQDEDKYDKQIKWAESIIAKAEGK